MSINIKKSHKGRFTEYKKRTGKTTEEALHSKNKHVRAMAQFAKNAKYFKHEDGGYLTYGYGGDILSGAASGASTGMMFGPWGAAIGGLIGGGIGALKANSEENISEQQDKQNMQMIAQNRLGQYNQQKMVPPFAYGGDFASYGYLPSAGVYAIGGDLNDINKRNDLGYKYLALGGNYMNQDTMKGYGYNLMEMGGHLPEGKATLKEAKELMKLYPEEMKAGEEVEYEHTGNKKFAQRIAADHIKDHLQMTGGKDPGYYKHLQEAGISDELNKMPQMANGGYLKPEKAAQMLKDGIINGKPLTDRQKRYFGFIANGGNNKADGGPIGTPPVKRPLSDLEMMNKMIKYGYHDNLDSLRKMKPEERQALIPPGSAISFEKVQKGTANQGGYKYYEVEKPKLPIPQPRNMTYTDSMIYSTGGIIDKIPSTGAINNQGTSGRNTNGIDVNQNVFTEYKGGGTHAQNPLGGIPIGGKAKVEADEVRVDFEDGSYIFSNQIAYKK